MHTAPNAAAAILGHMARLEHAAITAFEIMHRELVAHGAPLDLQRRARRAVDEETRHAAAMRGLARRAGVDVEFGAVVDHGGVRALVDVAEENVREGCVRESFGAVVAAWQAQHAGDRARVDAARGDAVRALEADASEDVDPQAAAQLGLPAREQAHALCVNARAEMCS